MKIAFLHFAYCCGRQEENAEKILRGIELAAKAGAEWVLTPEMALQGYWMVRSGHKYDYLDKTSLLLKKFQAAAQAHNITLFLGCAEILDDIKPRNSCVVIDAKGEICAKHSKIKVVKWITENWAVPGEAVTVFECCGIKTGLLVCADAWFEENGKQLKNEGAELIVVIAAWPPGGHAGPPEDAWRRCSKAAGEKLLLICNQTGREGMDCTLAQSAVVRGDEVKIAYSGEEAVLVVEIDEHDQRLLCQNFQQILIG